MSPCMFYQLFHCIYLDTIVQWIKRSFGNPIQHSNSSQYRLSGGFVELLFYRDRRTSISAYLFAVVVLLHRVRYTSLDISPFIPIRWAMIIWVNILYTVECASLKSLLESNSLV